MEKKWLTASCFCPRDSWDMLLKEIYQFIRALNRSDFLFYQIKINYNDGDNIRFSILTPLSKYNTIANDLDKRITERLSLMQKKSMEPIKSISLPLPTYTLQFGIYDMLYKEHSEELYKNQQLISELMFVAFNDEEITYDSIIVFCFYLQFALFKTCVNHLHKNERSFLYDLFTDANEVDHENLKLMHEIAIEVMQHDVFEGELNWLNTWIAFCEKGVQEKVISNDNKINMIKEYYKNVITMLHMQFAITKKVNGFLSGVLKYSVHQLFSIYY